MTANMHSYVVPSQKYISTIIIYYLVFYNSKFYSLINYILNSQTKKYMIGELYCEKKKEKLYDRKQCYEIVE